MRNQKLKNHKNNKIRNKIGKKLYNYNEYNSMLCFCVRQIVVYRHIELARLFSASSFVFIIRCCCFWNLLVFLLLLFFISLLIPNHLFSSSRRNDRIFDSIRLHIFYSHFLFTKLINKSIRCSVCY